VADSSNEAALAWLAAPATWPLGRLALHGPAGVGKTHLLRAFAPSFRHIAGAALTEAAALAPATPTALDDADAAPEAALFHLINRCAEARAPLLLAARTPPARWDTTLPDLKSRLRATTAAAIAEPSDPLLEALLAKHLADRQMRLDAATQAYLLARLPRQAAAIAEAVARLDAAALAEAHAVTRPFAARVLGLQDAPGA
jgi:chromosomal replication initiation ATPase DnaA